LKSPVLKVLTALALLAVVSGCTAEPKVLPDRAPSTADYGELMAECLGEYGFEGDVQGNGIVLAVPPEQADRYHEANVECQARYGFDKMTKMTDEELGEQYQFELQVKECLEGLGYVIELPTEQVYIDTYYSAPEGEGFLLPHTQIMNQVESRADIEFADSTCKTAPMLYDRPIR
jgi:hypothetical protein